MFNTSKIRPYEDFERVENEILQIRNRVLMMEKKQWKRTLYPPIPVITDKTSWKDRQPRRGKKLNTKEESKKRTKMKKLETNQRVNGDPLIDVNDKEKACRTKDQNHVKCCQKLSNLDLTLDLSKNSKLSRS